MNARCEFCFAEMKPLYSVVLGDRKSQMFRCEGCRSCQISPAFAEEDVRKLYEVTYFETQPGAVEKGRALAIDYLQKFKHLSAKGNSSGRALEIGAGFGFFAELARRELGIEFDVVEPSLVCQEELRRRRFNGRIYESLEELPPLQKYNLIFAFHVVEHLQSFGSFGRKVAAALEQDGEFWVLTPNARSKAFCETGELWGWCGPDQHFQFMSPDIPRAYFEKLGLMLLRTADLVPADTHYPSYWYSRLKKQIALCTSKLPAAGPLRTYSLRLKRRACCEVVNWTPRWPGLRRVNFERILASFSRRRPFDELLFVFGRTASKV